MDQSLLLMRCKQGDKAAREQMITENIGLVWSIVRRFLGRGYEADDLFQISLITMPAGPTKSTARRIPF